MLGTNLSSVVLLGTHADSGEERTDTDSCGTEVIDLVNLQYGENFIGAVQDVFCLIHCHGIQAAAEGV